MQIGQDTFTGGLISPLEGFFALFSDEYSVEASLNQSRDKNPEREI